MSISIFNYKNCRKYPIYISKNALWRHGDLLLIEDESKSHYRLIKEFNRFMYNKTFHHDKKTFLQLLFTVF